MFRVVLGSTEYRGHLECYLQILKYLQAVSCRGPAAAAGRASRRMTVRQQLLRPSTALARPGQTASLRARLDAPARPAQRERCALAITMRMKPVSAWRPAVWAVRGGASRWLQEEMSGGAGRGTTARWPAPGTKPEVRRSSRNTAPCDLAVRKIRVRGEIFGRRGPRPPRARVGPPRHGSPPSERAAVRKFRAAGEFFGGARPDEGFGSGDQASEMASASDHAR